MGDWSKFGSLGIMVTVLPKMEAGGGVRLGRSLLEIDEIEDVLFWSTIRWIELILEFGPVKLAGVTWASLIRVLGVGASNSFWILGSPEVDIFCGAGPAEVRGSIDLLEWGSSVIFVLEFG